MSRFSVLVSVILPNEPVPKADAGFLKLGVLVALKNSARNCSLSRSLIGEFLNSERSVEQPRPMQQTAAGVAIDESDRSSGCAGVDAGDQAPTSTVA